MQHMDRQSILEYIDKTQLHFDLCTVHLIHMEKDYMGLVFRCVLVVELLFFGKIQMRLLCIQGHICIVEYDW